MMCIEPGLVEVDYWLALRTESQDFPDVLMTCIDDFVLLIQCSLLVKSLYLNLIFLTILYSVDLP